MDGLMGYSKQVEQESGTEEEQEYMLARKRFSVVNEAWDRIRADAEDDLRMKVGDQWPSEIRELREKEKRPTLTFNRLHQHVAQAVGDIRKAPPSIKVRPVEDSDVEGVEVMDALFKHIQDNSNASVAYETAYEHMLGSSFGFFRVLIDYNKPDAFDQDILVKRIDNPFTVYIDPYTKEQDRSDMRYAFVTELVPQDEFEERYPDAEPIDVEINSLFDDRELWIQENSVRLAEYWSREPVKKTIVQMSNGSVHYLDEIEKDEELRTALDSIGAYVVNEREVDTYVVKQRVMNGVEFLEEKEWPGCLIPIIPVMGREDYVNGELRVFSLIRHAKDSQRMYNYWRSAEAEIIGLQPKAPYMATEKQIEGYEDMWEEANHQNFPYILFNPDAKNPGPPQRQQTPQVAAGMMGASQACIEEMRAATGQHEASFGQKAEGGV
jgi:hypothetical protein